MKHLHLLATLALLSAPSLTAGVAVTTLDDNVPGSLRAAIASAPAGDTLTFAAALNGQSIILTAGQLVIDKDLTIDASALSEGITIDANGAVTGHRVLTISAPQAPTLTSLPTVSLINLLITGGQTPDAVSGDAAGGGGILSQGNLSLIDCTISNNSTGDGGNVDADADADDGGFGGGIHFSGSGFLVLVNCTVSNNSTGDGDDDAEGSGGFGGGIYFFGSGSLSLNNCTVSNNSTGNGGAGNDGGFGGGIFNLNTPLTLSNTVIAGNSTGLSSTGNSGDGPDLSRVGTSFTRTGVNFIGDIAGSGISSPPPADILSGDPMLAPLGDYGGPTQTMLPLPGSPLIDVAGASTFTFDQRGRPRLVGTGGDIGAVEYAPSTDLLVIWALDFDGDGSPFGIEQALGTDPFTPDPAAAGNLTSPTINATGQAILTFGRNPDAEPHTIWRLTRTTDFLTFTEIFRFDGPNDTVALLSDINATVGDTSFTIVDETPPAAAAFYRFEAEPVFEPVL